MIPMTKPDRGWGHVLLCVPRGNATAYYSTASTAWNCHISLGVFIRRPTSKADANSILPTHTSSHQLNITTNIQHLFQVRLYLKPEFTKMTNLDHQILLESKAADAPSRDWLPESAQHHKFDARFQRQFFVPTLDLWLLMLPKGSQWCQKSCIGEKNWRRNLAFNLGLWHQFLESVSGACVSGLKLTYHSAKSTSRFASTSNVSCSILTMSCSVFADVLINSGCRSCNSCCITDTYNTHTHTHRHAWRQRHTTTTHTLTHTESDMDNVHIHTGMHQ